MECSFNTSLNKHCLKILSFINLVFKTSQELACKYLSQTKVPWRPLVSLVISHHTAVILYHMLSCCLLCHTTPHCCPIVPLFPWSFHTTQLPLVKVVVKSYDVFPLQPQQRWPPATGLPKDGGRRCVIYKYHMAPLRLPMNRLLTINPMLKVLSQLFVTDITDF